jgi:hypothetical protein
MVKLLSPIGVSPSAKADVASRVGSLDGKTICIIDNGKPNFDVYVERIEALLRRKHNLAEVIHIKKGHLGSSNPTPQNQVDDLAKKCHAVISGLGD